MMNTEPLIALIRKYDLSQHQAKILDSVRPAIFFGLAQGQSEIGQSRIGGVPDFPSSISWPKSQACDKYLCFILQINFVQLPRFPESPFPSQGMLYLFTSEGKDAAEQIVLFDGADPLQPCPQPDPAEMMTDWYEDVVPHTLLFALAPDIPRWATDDFYSLCNDFNIDEEPLDDIAREFSKNLLKNYAGKLLGHAAGIGHDPRQDAYVTRDVNPDWVYDYKKRKTLDMTHAQRWRNLLTIKSNGAADLWFGDAGYLQVLIHDSDLSRMDLSRVYVGLESS